MMKRLAIVLTLALALAACSAATEELTEQIAENAAGVDDLEVDTETGEVSFETEDGSVSIGGGDVPEGLPFQPPSGGDVMMSLVTDDTIAVNLSYDLDRFDELVSFVSDYADSSGVEYSKSESTLDLGNGNVQQSAVWTGDDWFMSVTSCFTGTSTSDSFDAACLGISST